MKKAKNKTKQDTKLPESHVPLKVSSAHIPRFKKIKYIRKVSTIRTKFFKNGQKRGPFKVSDIFRNLIVAFLTVFPCSYCN